jgi:hypothetical protein
VSSSLIRQDLVPMIVGYVLIMGSLATGLRIVQRSGRTAAAGAKSAKSAGGSRRLAGPPVPVPVPEGQVTVRSRLLAAVAPDPGWRRLAIFSLGTAVGGYVLLMAVIIAYYYGVARVAGNFVHSAFSGCAMLIGLAAAAFIALSWLTERKGWRL